MQYPWRCKFQYSALVLLMAGFLLHPFLASAGPLISINPAHVELTATPGGHLTSSFKFWNGTSAGLLIRIAGLHEDLGIGEELAGLFTVLLVI